MGVLLVAFLLVAPFAAVRLPGNNAFIPIVQTVLFFGDLITAVLIYTQYSISRSRALLVLASGYLFTALIIIPHTLSFPNVFAPNGLLGPALQTTGWLHIIWHFSFPAAVIGYVLFGEEPNLGAEPQGSRLAAVFCSMGIVAASVCAITWGLLSAESSFLPRLFVDRTLFAPLVLYMGLLDTLVCAIALLLLWLRKKSVLDQWLIIALFATLLEMLMVTFLSAGRFDLGWYAVRLFSVTAAVVVLLGLLAETTNMYAKLAATGQALKQERNVSLMTVEAATGAMAHEIGQQLTVITVSGQAALILAKRKPPDLNEVNECLTAMVGAAHNVNDIIAGVRGLFNTRAANQKVMLSVNDVIEESLNSLKQELRDNGIVLTIEFNGDLPRIYADRTQIQQLLFNLVKNAMEAMRSGPPEKRSLHIITDRKENTNVVVYVRDSGPGISAENQKNIFEPFFTTKHAGTGLGLSICRTIVERHGGQLRIDQSGPQGTTFEISLSTEAAP